MPVGCLYSNIMTVVGQYLIQIVYHIKASACDHNAVKRRSVFTVWPLEAGINCTKSADKVMEHHIQSVHHS